MKFFYESENMNLYKDSQTKKYILRYDLVIKINRGDSPIIISIEKSSDNLEKVKVAFLKDLEKEAKRFVSKYAGIFIDYKDFLYYLEK